MTKTTRTSWQLNEGNRNRLIELSKQGLTLTGAAKELGLDRNTVTRAAVRSGQEDWLEGLFPNYRRYSMNKRKAMSASHQQRQMRALTRAWV